MRAFKKNPDSVGSVFIRPAVDHFVLRGQQEAMHLCLVYEAMRETLSQFQQRIEDGRIPPQLLKVYDDFILEGLEYLHFEWNVIHTGQHLAFTE